MDDVDVVIFYGWGNWPGLWVEKLYVEYLLLVCLLLLLIGEKFLKILEDLVKYMLLYDVLCCDW